MVRRGTLAPDPPPRPRRGSPEETRERLVQAAAECFNRDGFDGTDSNRIARAAGYSPGTFYKHFADKVAIFLAVYDEWVSREWRDVSLTLAEGGTATEQAHRIVDIFLAHHRRWRGIRASLRALVTTEPTVREVYREQRRRQFVLLDELQRKLGGPTTSREENALLLFSIERTADAVAEGEAEALGLGEEALRALLADLVRRRLEPSRAAPPR